MMEAVILRIASLCIGYVFGMFQTGYIYGRLHGLDIRDYGSGNAGTTNVLRTLGKKAAVITYFGDAIKSVLSALVIYLLFGRNNQDMAFLYVLYGGLGVILGHNFPCYLRFRGGKGIAATSGMLLSLFPFNHLLVVLGFFTFMGVVLVSRYVSLASLVMIAGFFIEFVIMGQLGMIDVPLRHLPESYCVVFVISALAFIRHKDNIRRLLSGTERKLGKK
jgi:glycerol-3-phosphate acyltransferase PlsY